MTNRYRLAAMAYPSHYRAAHYPELLATADELSAGRWSLRQGWSLLRHGLDTRCRLATTGAPHRIWRLGARFGLAMVLALNALLSAAIGASLTDPLATPVPNVIECLFVAGAVGLLAGNIRLWATITVTIAAVSTAFINLLLRPALSPYPLLVLLVGVAVAWLCWWATDPSTQTPSNRQAARVAALTAVAGAVVAAPILWFELSTGVVVAVGTVTIALALLTIVIGGFLEPRLAAAAACYLTLAAGTRYATVVSFDTSMLLSPGEASVLLAAIVLVMLTVILTRRGAARISAL